MIRRMVVVVVAAYSLVFSYTVTSIAGETDNNTTALAGLSAMELDQVYQRFIDERSNLLLEVCRRIDTYEIRNYELSNDVDNSEYKAEFEELVKKAAIIGGKDAARCLVRVVNYRNTDFRLSNPNPMNTKPVVQALIHIGVPAVEVVLDQLDHSQTLDEKTLQSYVFVLVGVLGREEASRRLNRGDWQSDDLKNRALAATEIDPTNLFSE